MKLQVVILDKRDYILRYSNFDSTTRKGLLRYLAQALLDDECFKIDITKWERNESIRSSKKAEGEKRDKSKSEKESSGSRKGQMGK